MPPMKSNAVETESQPANIIAPTPPTPRLGRMPTATSKGVRRQRFRILDFANESGSRAYRVQGMTRDKVYVRENYSDLREAECRRTQLENEYLLGDDAPLRAPRMTILTEDQLRLAEEIFRTMHKAEAEDCDLRTAVTSWLKAGRQKDQGIAPRLDEAFELYKAWLDTTPTLRLRSKDNYAGRTRVFVNSIENYRLDAITPDMIEAFLAKREISALSKINDLRVLVAFFKWAGDRPRRWLTINPAAAVTVEVGERPEPAILTVAQCKALLRAAEAYREGRMVPTVVVCLFGGLRPSEAHRLTWPAVNLDDRELRLASTDTKTGRSRIVPIVDTLAAWLKAYPDWPFCLSDRGMAAIRLAAGIAVWPPDVLRHTSISHYFRLTGSYGKTAEYHGNSESIIKRHYQGRVSSKETEAFYALLPKGGRS